MSNGKIDCYVDIASFYSYIAFVDILKNQALLQSHGVDVEFIPVLIGGINSKSGNKPPWTLPAKAQYAPFDAMRTAERVGKPGITAPEDLMSRSLTVLPMRALLFIKANYNRETFETVLHYLFHCFWTPPHRDVAAKEVFQEILAEVPSVFPETSQTGRSSKTLFGSSDVQKILDAAASPEYKDALKRTTDDAVNKGAFGAPWLWVRNRLGQEEPFFGSDRSHFVYKFLGLPYEDVKLLPPPVSDSASRHKL